MKKIFQEDIDDVYTLELLEKINSISYNGNLLANSFFYNGYNLWHLSQQKLLENTRIFSKTKKFVHQIKQSRTAFLKDIIGETLIVLHSAISFLFLVITRKKILIYSIDKASTLEKADFRLIELYEALSNSGAEYFEFFHTVLNRDALKNLITRRRFSIYLEALDYIFSLLKWLHVVNVPNIQHIDNIDLSNFTDNEQQYVRQQLERIYTRACVAVFKMKILSRLFKCSNLKALFAIDDGAYYFECLQACKEAGIETYAIQHGLFTKYNVGALKNIKFKGNYITPDWVLVWSEYWKKELIRLGTNFEYDSIIIGGLKNKNNSKEESNSSLIKENTITILIPYETAAPKHEIKEYILKLLECPQINVIFKLRTDRTSEEQLSDYGITTKFHKRFTTVFDIDEVLPRVTLVMGSYSTFLYDMLMCDKHIVILKTSSDFGMPMVYNGIADLLDINTPDFCARVIELSSVSEMILTARKEILVGTHPVRLTETLQQIIARKL